MMKLAQRIDALEKHRPTQAKRTLSDFYRDVSTKDVLAVHYQRQASQ